MTKTYDAVIRVSRKNGRDGDRFLSPNQQRADIETLAERNDYKIARWFDESDSVSGKTTDRAGLNAAVERAVNGETDGILVAKLDRFSRTVVGGLTVINRLKAAGRELIAAREGAILGPDSDATSNLLRNIFLSLAEWQLETLTEGWEAVRADHIARGVHNIEPFGYLKDEDRRLAIVEREAYAVHRMFTERADGAGWVGIAAGLIADEIPTRNGHGWTPGRVKSIIENRVYLGEVRSGEFINREAHPAIVTEELWNRANNRRKTTARRDGEDYRLTGLLYCAECGVKMRGTARTHASNGRRYRDYRCRKDHPFGKCPNPAYISGEEIETYVMDAFADRFFGMTMMAHADTSALDAATAELEAAEYDLATAAVDPVLTRLRTVSPVAYADGMTARMVRVESARDAVGAARNEALGVEFPADLETLWPELPADRQRTYLAQAFDLIAVERLPAGRHRGFPVADRVRIFGHGEAPAGIIGRRLHGPIRIAL